MPTKLQLIEFVVTRIVKRMLTEESNRQEIKNMINKLIDLKQKRLNTDDPRDQNKMDRDAAEVAGHIYDLMGDSSADKDDIAPNTTKGKLAMMKLIHRYYVHDPRMQRDLDAYYQLRRKKLKDIK